MTINQTESEAVTPAIVADGMSIGKIVWTRFVRHRAAMASGIVFVGAALLVFTSIGVGPLPGWWKWDHNDRGPIVNPQGAPTLGFENGWIVIGDHPFGQDEIGRDIFARVMQGAQVSLLVMFIMGIVATVLGVLVGAFAGYYRGWLDNILMRMTEVVIAIPTLVVTAVVGRMLADREMSLFGVPINASDPWFFGLVLGLLLWPGLARLLRAEFLTLREREFVDAAKVAGARDRSIMFRHIVPNAMGVIIVNTTLLMAASTILEAALSYLGFGIQAPNVSLGTLISEYQTAFAVRPWLFWWPGLFIVIFALTINLVGDGLRDAFDPRQKRIPKARDFAKKALDKQEKEIGA